jgi:mRNA interferase YafQ
MNLVWDHSFKRAFKRFVKKNPQFENKIFESLERLSDNPFAPALKSHKLTGQLEGLWACSVAYDCRIIFTFRRDEALNDNIVILIDIGSHDDVY